MNIAVPHEKFTTLSESFLYTFSLIDLIDIAL